MQSYNFSQFYFQIERTSMEVLKSFEDTVFRKIISLQKIRMQSEAVFIFLSLLSFIFKDAYVLLMYLSQLNMLNTLATAAATQLIAYSIPISLSLLLFVAAIYVLYVGGTQWGESVKDFSRLFLPFADLITFSIVTTSMIIIHSTSNIGLIVSGIAAMSGMSFFSLCYNIFNFSKSPKTNNLFQFKQAKSVMASYILQLIFCYYLAISWSSRLVFSSQELIVYCLLKLMLTAIKFKQKIIHKFYINSFAQKISSFFYFMELSLASIASAMSIFQIDLIGSNITYILAIMSVLAYISFSVYIERRDGQLYLSSASDIRDEDQALLYLDCLAQLSRKIQNQEQDIILISLKTKHELACNQVECFCKTTGQNIKKFITNYIKCQLEVMNKFFHNELTILLSVLYFKMVLFKFYPEILSKLTEYETKFNFSIIQRFYKHSLTQYVQTYILRKNIQIDSIQSEQIFKLEELTSEIQKSIKNQVEMREKLWKYLSRGLCQVGELQVLCGNELSSIKRVMHIYLQNRVKFKKSKEFNILILFYFTKVSFLRNGKEIRNNLKEIYYGYKIDELQSIKQFKKFIYHKRSCAIQTHIDPKVMGIITAASHNVEEMFGFPYERVIGTSINTLMPQFMAGQHQHIMNEWAKVGAWQTVGKLKEVYCIHKEQYCFSALLYLKIYMKESGIHFITNIFKINENDFLVVDSEGRIEGLGKKFLKIFGETAKRMPLSLLVQSKVKNFQPQAFEEGRVYRRVLMSVKGAEKQVQSYLQSLTKNQSTKRRVSTNQSFYDKLTVGCNQKYFVEFTAKKYKIGQLTYNVLKMIEFRAIQRNKTSYFLEQSSNYISSIRQHITNELEIEASERKSQKSLEEEDAHNMFDNNCNSSMASLSEKENYPLSKLIQNFLQYLQNPQKIRDNRIKHITCGIFLFLVVLSILNFLSYLIYWAVLSQIQNIFFADGAVNDIMQGTEIAYDHVFNLRAQLMSKNLTNFDSQMKSAQYLQSYVYGLKEYSFAHLITDRTKLTQKKIYSYIQSPVDWHTQNKTLQVQIYQFLQLMYYLTGQLMQQMQTLRLSNATQMNFNDSSQFNSKYFQILADNFPEIENMNEFYLQSYKANSIDSHRILNISSLSSIVLHFIITLLGAFYFDKYYRFRFNQVQRCFRFYGVIPHSYFEKLREYYSELTSTVIQDEQLKDLSSNQDKLFAIDTHQLFARAENSKASINSKLRIVNYSNYYRWIFILLAFLGLNGFNYMGTTNVRNFFEPSQQIIQLTNELMRAQNRYLQSYFNLKAAYYLNPTTKYTDKFLLDVKNHLNVSTSTWNTIANDIITSFSPYASGFQTQFTNTLIDNVCTISSEFLPESQNIKCVNELQLKVLEGGIMMAMNYFQVAVQGAIEQMRAQYVSKGKPLFAGNFYQTQTYTQLDKMLVYMFKLWQLTQKICFQSYTMASSQVSWKFAMYIIAFSMFYALIIAYWLLSIPGQKQRLSWLYGQLLLVPFNILKSNNRIVVFFKQAIQYSDV